METGGISFSPWRIGTSNFNEALELFLNHSTLGCFAAKVIDLFVEPTEISARLVELALELFGVARNGDGFLFLKTVEQVELRCWARGNLFDLILAEDIRAENLVAIERDRHRCSCLVQNLNALVGCTPGCVTHVCLRSNRDADATVSEVRRYQGIDGPVSLWACFGVGHESKPEAKKLEGSSLPGPPAPD